MQSILQNAGICASVTAAAGILAWHGEQVTTDLGRVMLYAPGLFVGAPFLFGLVIGVDRFIAPGMRWTVRMLAAWYTLCGLVVMIQLTTSDQLSERFVGVSTIVITAYCGILPLIERLIPDPPRSQKNRS